MRLATDCYINNTVNRLGLNERGLQHRSDNRIQITVILIDVVVMSEFFGSLFLFLT